MPLIKCRDCDGQLSTNAKTCPHCGTPVKLNAVEQTLHNLDATVNRLKALEEFNRANPAAAWARYLFLSVGFGAIGGAILTLLFHEWSILPKDGVIGSTITGAAIGLVFGIVSGGLDPMADIKNGVLGFGTSGLILGAIGGLVVGFINPSLPICWIIVGAVLGSKSISDINMSGSVKPLGVLITLAAGAAAAWGLHASTVWIHGAIAGGAFGFGLLLFAILRPASSASEE